MSKPKISATPGRVEATLGRGIVPAAPYTWDTGSWDSVAPTNWDETTIGNGFPPTIRVDLMRISIDLDS